MTPRLIRLKYAGVCRSCGRSIGVGNQAYWEPGGGVACRSCGTQAFLTPRHHYSSAGRRGEVGHADSSNQADAGTTPRPSGPTPTDQRLWTAYCEYLLACVEAEDRDNESVLESGQGWIPLGVNLLLDVAADVAAPSDVATGARAGDASLRVGWPVLVLPRDDGTHRLVPLLTMEVDATAGIHPMLVPLDQGPTLNPKLPGLLDASDAAALEQVARENPDLPAREMAGLMLDLLGMPAEPLDVPPHPPTSDAAVQNSVILEVLAGTMFTASLRRELQDLRARTDWEHTAAAALLRGHAVDAPAENVEVVASPVPLNDSQVDAVLASRAPLTVITGPPGTGKSQVVTALGATSWIRGESFLVTSTNNAAVDVASARLQQVHPVLVLRSGNQEHRQKLARTAATLLDRPVGPGPSKQGRASLRSAYVALDEMRTASTERSRLQLELLAAHSELEQASEGVLVDQHQAESEHAAVVRRIARLTRKGQLTWWGRRGLGKAAPRVGLRHSADPSAVHAWAVAWQRATELIQRVRASGPLAPAGHVDALEDEWRAASADVLGMYAAHALQAGRPTLRRLADQRPLGRGRALLDPGDLATLRGWAVTALSVARTLPLQAGAVDLLILDEASQCSLAHALPLAYRAKRAVILGDPHQLTPVIRLSVEQEQAAMARAGVDAGWLAKQRLSFRESSTFDAFTGAVDDVRLLNEHYRCHPAISGWFNREFYGGSLTVLTTVDTDSRRGIESVPVVGTTERGPTGSWVNYREVDALVGLAQDLATDGTSLGVVTPYAAQAAAVRAALAIRCGEDWMERHEVAVATAHRFQGSERDVMLFSSVVTPATPVRSARWLEMQRHLINVGASRARRLLVLVGHPDAPSAHGLTTLGSLWAAASTPVIEAEPDPTDLTEPERRFWQAFDASLDSTRPRQRVDGYDVDFAWTSPWGMPVDIEIDDDDPHDKPRSRRRDIERDRVLNAVGWQVLRIPGWYCYSHPDAVIESLRDTLPTLQNPTSSTVELMPWVGR